MKNTFLKSLILALAISIVPTPMMAMEEQPLTIFQAAQQGNLQRLKELLAAGESANSKDQAGNTLLYYAIRDIKGDALLSEVVTCLINAGANPEAWIIDEAWIQHNSIEERPLTFASRMERLAAVLALLKGGAMPNLRNGMEQSALMLAAEKGQHNICQALIEHNATVQATDWRGFNSFDYALEHANHTECINSMICHSLFTNNYAWNKRKEVIDRVMEALLCFKELKIPKDIRRKIVGELKDDMEVILTQNILRGKKIPLFAQPVMIDALYESTRNHLIYPIQDTAQRRPEVEILNMDNFENNFGEQLRMYIQSRVENPTLKVPAKKGFLNSNSWELLKRVITPKPSIKKLLCNFAFFYLTNSTIIFLRSNGNLSPKTALLGFVFALAGMSTFFKELFSHRPLKELIEWMLDIQCLYKENKNPIGQFQ